MTKPLDLIGKRFGRLVVVGKLPLTKHRKTRWKCQCDCGATKAVTGSHLTNGKIRSCRCLQRETAASNGSKNVIHGGGKSPEYRTYSMMRHRCLNENNIGYRHYGGRGITICQRWLDSFENFLEDMGPRPEGTSIERIDNDGNYEPGNCKWATRSEQAKNTRTTRHFTIDGVTKPLRDWIGESRWETSTVYKRLQRGMSLEDALRG